MRIKEIREAKGISQRQAAIELNLSPVVYGRYENGLREPSNIVLVSMADYFGVSVDELLGRRTAQEQASMDGLMLDEKRIIDQYRRLTDEGKTKAFEYLLLLQHQYRRDDDAQT